MRFVLFLIFTVVTVESARNTIIQRRIRSVQVASNELQTQIAHSPTSRERRLLRKKKQRLKELRNEVRQLSFQVKSPKKLSKYTGMPSEWRWKRKLLDKLKAIVKRLDRLERATAVAIRFPLNETTTLFSTVSSSRTTAITPTSDQNQRRIQRIQSIVQSRNGENGTFCSQHSDCRPGRCCERGEAGEAICTFYSLPADSSCSDSCQCANRLLCFKPHDRALNPFCKPAGTLDIKRGRYVTDVSGLFPPKTAKLRWFSKMAESATPEFHPVAESTNPGSFEELHRKAKDVFPACFEGAKLMVNKGLSSHFQVSHTLTLSSMASGYRFGATYVGTKTFGPQEAYPIFLGDTDISGNTTATVLHQWDKYRTRIQGQVQQGKLAGAQASLERRGRLSTLSCSVANLDLVNESGILVGQFLRRITKQFDLGAELVYQYGRQVPGSQISILSYGARYITPIWTAAASFGISGAHLTYYHKQHENLAFGVEFECNTNVGEAVTTIAYQAEIPEEGVTMRASVDTNWNVSGVFEKRLGQQLPFTLALSGIFNHVKSAGRFGVGLVIG